MRISDWSSDVCSSDLPLPPKSAKGFRHQNPAQRPRFVENCPMVALQLPADVDVLGDHIEAPIAHVIKCTTTEGCDKIGRASCRARVCQYVSISVVAVSLKTKATKKTI